MIPVENPAAMTQYLEYAELMPHLGSAMQMEGEPTPYLASVMPMEAEPMPYLGGAAPMEAVWPSPACQPIMAMPTVLSTQPSNSYMDQQMVPFQEPPVMAPPQASYTVVQVVVPAEASNPPPACKEKQRLLLAPFLQPPSQKQDKPDKPEKQEKPDKVEKPRARVPRKVLAPGLVGAARKVSTTENAKPLEVSESSEEVTMDAREAASLFREGQTTVMLRNIPNRYTCEELLCEVMTAGFDHMFDFFYLPMDFKTKRNLVVE